MNCIDVMIVFYFEFYYGIFRVQHPTLEKVFSGHAKSNSLIQSECSSETLNQIRLEAQRNCQHLQTDFNQHKLYKSFWRWDCKTVRPL